MSQDTKKPDSLELDRPRETPVFSIDLDAEAGAIYRGAVPKDPLDSSSENLTVESFFNVTERFRAFPNIPDFGVFYLSISAAAELIVEDLLLSGRWKPMHQSAYKLSRRHSEKAVASERRKRIDDFATRLMRALEEGHLTCRTQPRDFDDFLKGASGRFLPERAYIHFNDLLAWLREQGYVDHSAPNALGPAFQAYEEREIALAEEVANDIRVRRSLHGKRAPEGWENVLPPISAEDERLRLQEQLSDAIKKIQVLEQQVLALHPPAGDEITEGTRASRSDLLIITALFELAKINPAGASATTALALQISKFLRSLDPATIRRRVKGAAALRGRIDAELNASTEHRKK